MTQDAQFIREREYLYIVRRTAERLIFPAHGLAGHYPHFDRINGHEKNSSVENSIAAAAQAGKISWDEAMDLELASMITSGKTNGHREEGAMEVRLAAGPQDIEAAQRRAGTLQQVMGAVPVTATVITAHASGELRHQARDAGVRLLVFNPQGEFHQEG